MHLRRPLSALVALAVVTVLAGCAAGPTAPPPAPASQGVTGGASSQAPAAWRTAVLTDVRTGERFTIEDLAGSVVVVEPMAIWCTNCLRQQRAAADALAGIGGDAVVYISLDVDPSERPEDLAAYADERGFDWRFVVAGRELSRELARTFGDDILSPPSTPKVIISPSGAIIGPKYGFADAQAVEHELRALLG